MYLIGYICVLCISITIVYIHFSNKNRIRAVKIITIASAFAWYSASLGEKILIDRQSYNYMFLHRFPNESSTWNQIFENTIEPGYIMLNLFIKSFTNNPFWIYFIITFMVIVIDMYVINKLALQKGETAIYYLMSMQIFFSFYLCRQILAASIINLAFLFFMNNKKILSFITIIISSLFHTTAIVAFPIFFMFDRCSVNKKNLKRITVLVIVALILYEPLINILMINKILINYFGDLTYNGLHAGWTIIFKGLPYHLITFYALRERNNLLKLMKNADIYILATIVNSACWVLSVKMYWMYRLSMYVVIPSLILIPYILKVCNKKDKNLFYKFPIIATMILITLREVLITL